MNTLRLSLLLIAVGVLGLLGWRSIENHRQPVASLSPPVVSPPPATTAPASAPVATAIPAAPPTPDERIAEIPEFADFYVRLRSTFPQDFETFHAALEKAKPMPAADAAIWEAMRDLQQSRGVLAAEAGASALDRYFDARSAMVDGLAPLNPHLCADFLYGETGASIADFTASHRGLVATLADRQLAAITDGLAEHVERAPPTDADLDALTAALMQRGLSRTEISFLIDGQTPEQPLTDARLCEIGQHYLEALQSLSAETRNRIYGLAAELLARS